MNQVQGIIASIINDHSPVLNSWSRAYNCPVCGDRRKRGNHMFNSDGSFSYHCYNENCGTGWTPGIYIGKKLESNLLKFGATVAQIEQLKFYAKEIADSGDFENLKEADKSLFQDIKRYPMPPNAYPLIEIANSSNPDPDFLKVLEAISERNVYLLDLDIYWTPLKKNRFNERFIIPYKMNNEIIGYTARHIDENHELRYYNQVCTGVFYNYDLLEDDNIKTILVLEGPIDAALAGGVSANRHTLTDKQIQLLLKAKERGKEIVIVPDRDKDGINAIKQALEHGFSVSFPEFGNKFYPGGIVKRVKDLDEACNTYGRLFCVQLIYSSICKDPVQIQYKMTTWF